MRQIAVDSSALIAILFREKGYEQLAAEMRPADVVLLIGAPTMLETLIVLSRAREEPEVILGTLLAGKRHEIVAFDQGMVMMAYEAFRIYGKGRHPAALNYGDCMAYAVARVFDVPLLFKGEDFLSTDVRRAIP